MTRSSSHVTVRRTALPFAILLVLFLAVTADVSAQSWNRATFRGDELGLRDFDYNEEYFGKVWAYQPDKEWRQAYENSNVGYLFSTGSLKIDEFYMHQRLKAHAEAMDGFWMQYDLIQDEDYDTRYLRQRPSFRYALDEMWQVYVFAEGTAYKEDNDLGAGVYFSPAEGHLYEAQFTFTDFMSEKGRNFRKYQERAYGMVLKGLLPLGDSFQLRGGAHAQFPLQMYDQGANVEKFEFKKYVFEGGLGWRITEDSLLEWFFEADTGAKDTYYSNTDVDALLDRDAIHTGIQYEWWMDSMDARAHCGVSAWLLEEETVIPDDLLQNFRFTQYQYMAFGGLAYGIADGWTFRPAVFMAVVDEVERFRNNTVLNREDLSIETKVNLAFEYRFTENVRLVLNPTLDIGDNPFDAGNLQLMAIF